MRPADTRIRHRSERIFNRHDSSFDPAVLAKPGGRGVNVVLNSLGSSLLQAGFEVLAPGNFIEIGKRDLEQNILLEVTAVTRAASFMSVVVMALVRQRRLETHRVLSELAPSGRQAGRR